MKTFSSVLIGVLLLGMVGCTGFEPVRMARYVDESNHFVTIEYGKIDEPHKSVFRLPNGKTWDFESKDAVRVYLPDDDDFFAYRHMSQIGTLYVSDDGEWEFLERGPNCILARKAKQGDGYVPCYRGNLCGTQRVQRDQGSGGSAHSHTAGQRQSSDKKLKIK